MDFRYRFVDFGTVFQAGNELRSAREADLDPHTLHQNELALDVGGVCWGEDGETLSVIDHHLQRPGHSPRASTAVLQLAPQIRAKYAGKDFPLIWLVTHKFPVRGQADGDHFMVTSPDGTVMGPVDVYPNNP